MRHWRLPTGIGTLLLSVLGCHSSDESMLRSSANLQQKPQLEKGINSVDPNSTGDDPIVAHVTYLVEVNLNSGLRPCAGEITLAITQKFTMELPNSKIRCLSSNLDIGALVGNQLNSSSASSFDPKALKSDGLIFSLAEIAGGKFDPPRPFLIGPIVQDTSALAGLRRHIDTTLTVEKPGNGESSTAQGSFDITVLDVAATYTNKYLSEPLTDVLHWTIETSGFDRVSPIHGLIVKKIEWYWNLRPIMIPKIIISVDRLGAFLTNPSQDDLSQLVGTVTVNITAKDWQLGEQ